MIDTENLNFVLDGPKKKWKPQMYWVPMTTLTKPARRKETWIPSSDPRKTEDYRRWSLGTSRFNETQLATAATIAAAARLSHLITRNFRLKQGLRDPMRKGTLATVVERRQVEIIGQCGTKTSFNLCSNQEGSGTKDGDFSTDLECNQYTVHNGTSPAFAHSSTRGHALTLSLAWLRPSRFIFAPWKKRHL